MRLEIRLLNAAAVNQIRRNSGAGLAEPRVFQKSTVDRPAAALTSSRLSALNAAIGEVGLWLHHKGVSANFRAPFVIECRAA